MNYIEISKLIMNGEKIYNIPLRVCFYARVSTDSDVQLNSLDNQLEYYEKYIKSHSCWTYVPGYVDEGISGVRVGNREGFKRMLKDAKANKFDLIITKEVSRFARDLEDSIHYIRELKNANVGIFFENQNLNTFDSNSELILNIMFNLAQDESKKLSSRVKFGHRQAILKGHVLGSSNIMGYKKENCKLVVVESEAKFIKKLFELYATGEYGFYKLSKKLASLGYFNKKGNLYDKDTLKRMLENPKYKGYYRGKTTEVLDYRTKKRKKVTEDNQIIHKCIDGSVPAIVSVELWEKVNSILKLRTKGYLNNNYAGGLKYPLSSKIYCQEHNTNYQRTNSRNKNRPTWCCGKYLQFNLDACTSPIIAEIDLYNILGNIFQEIIPHKDKIVEEMLELYKNSGEDEEYKKELNDIQNSIKKIENKKSFVLDLVYNGEIKKENLQIEFEKLDEKIENLKRRKQFLLNQIELTSNKDDFLKLLMSAIKKEINNGALDDFIRQFVKCIIVSKVKDDRHNIILDIIVSLENDENNIKKEMKEKLENKTILFKNKKYNSIEKMRKDKEKNKFIYNVYIEN